MKTMKKLLALTLALAMVLSLAVSVAAEGETTYTITITNDRDGHTYEAYQVFKGDFDAETENLSNIDWGTGVKGSELLAALNVDTVCDGIFKDCADARAVAETLGKDENQGYAEAFAKIVAQHLSTVTGSTNTLADGEYTISGLTPGYYFVKDENDSLAGDHDAYTSYILRVVDNVDVTPKNAFPTVDKQVWDETDDAEPGSTDGWGETADHAINESFQFKLIAAIAKDEHLADYTEYTVVFNDTMSKGITFEDIVSVKVNGGEPLDDADYTMSAITDGANDTKTFSITIDDIVPYLGTDKALKDGATIEVIYKAHLNEDAVMAGSDQNQNKVNLEYSNNPNVETELGKTPDDTVYVFTYEMPNTKYQNDESTVLEGAGFNLYEANGTTKVELVAVYDTEDTEKVLYYRPIDPEASPAETAVEHMYSGANGKFDIRGLDAGTYVLKETDTPAGFNTCDPLTIKIEGTHSENADETSATDTFTMKQQDKDDSTKWTQVPADGNKIVNLSGAQLPSTGGIGTTIFYLVGGLLSVGAVILLITKKKMSAI